MIDIKFSQSKEMYTRIRLNVKSFRFFRKRRNIGQRSAASISSEGSAGKTFRARQAQDRREREKNNSGGWGISTMLSLQNSFAREPHSRRETKLRN
jgi:hypothetical protein